MSPITQSLQPQLDRVRRAWRDSPLPGFFAWWLGELKALLPARWRAKLGSGEVWHLLSLGDGQWSIRQSGALYAAAQWPDEPALAEAPLASGPPASYVKAVAATEAEDLRLALCLPTGVALRRALTLPQAARDNLRQVAAYEMDRQTPFRAEQVYYAVRPLGGPTAAGRFPAELVVVPKAALDPLLARLQAQRLTVDAVDLAEGQGRLGVNLLPPAMRPHHSRPRQRLNLVLGAVCLILLVLCLNQWQRNREAALAAMQAQVDSLRTQAAQVNTLRQRLQDYAGAATFLSRRKAAAAPVIGVLQELTERLGDDTWLERLSIDNSGRLGFQGQSPQAAKLVDALRGAQLVGEASFQGTIQKDPTTGKERFYMSAQVHAPAAAKPAAAASSGAAR